MATSAIIAASELTDRALSKPSGSVKGDIDHSRLSDGLSEKYLARARDKPFAKVVGLILSHSQINWR